MLIVYTKKYLILILSSIIMMGCAHGLTGKLPIVTNKDNRSEIVVVRSCNVLMGVAVSFYISIDDSEIFAIRNCEYTRMYVPSGEHILGLENKAYTTTGINVIFNPNKTYYYFVGDSFDLVLSAVSEDKANKMLSQNYFSYLQIDETLGPLSIKKVEIQ